jgi:MinD superfamily P-loop ATPase
MMPRRIGELKHVQNDRLHFVESRLDIGQEQAVPLISQTLHYTDTWFSNDVVKIFDAPPGTSCPVMEAIKDTDFVILVTEPTPFGLHDLKLAVETTRQLKKDFGVVINRDGLGNNDVQHYCERENLPILARIRNDRHIAELYSRGELIHKHHSEVRIQLEKIFDHVRKVYAGVLI